MASVTRAYSPPEQQLTRAELAAVEAELEHLGVHILAGYALPLEPWHAAELLARAMGGPGSGNFGHAGRPGEVGGSASNVAAAPFTVEVEKLLTPYRERGIQVRNALVLRGPVDSHIDHVKATLAARGWEYKEGVSLDDEEGNINGVELQFSDGDDWLNVYMHGDAERTVLVGDHTAMDSGGKLHDDPVFVPAALRNLGGPGSGNFGHAGRPGEVGGSGPSEGFPPADRLREGDMNSGAAYEADIDKLDSYMERLENRYERDRDYPGLRGPTNPIAAIDEYIHDGYKDVNRALHTREGRLKFKRAQEKDPLDVKDPIMRQAMMIQDAIQDAPKIDVIVYRGADLSSRTWEKMEKVGETVSFAGITSTSFDPVRATRFGGRLLEIRAKRGIIGNGGESELLLEHAAKYVVRGHAEVEFKGNPNSAWERSGKIRVVQLEQIL